MKRKKNIVSCLVFTACAAVAVCASPSDEDVAISNGVLDVVVSPRGAELRSVRAEGVEYMWQREPGRPSGMAPVLFPICGSLNGGRYMFEGREYHLPVHGFAKDALFRADRAADGAGAVLTLESDETTKAAYPFDFALSVAVRFPDMPDVGFWHAPGEAPFLCIEPWTGMPSVAGVPDDFAVRPDMIRLAPGAAATLRYFVEFR